MLKFEGFSCFVILPMTDASFAGLVSFPVLSPSLLACFAKTPIGMKVSDLFFHKYCRVNETVGFFPLLKKHSWRQLSCTSLGVWWLYQNWYKLIMQELTQPGSLSASPGIWEV